MKNSSTIALVCFIIAGTCFGVCGGLIIAARLLPSPEKPPPVQRAISRQLTEINKETDGMLEQRGFDENKWMSDAYARWYGSLSDGDQRIIDFHDHCTGWLTYLMIIGVGAVVAGFYFRTKRKVVVVCDN